jgi:stage II sporulation protein R
MKRHIRRIGFVALAVAVFFVWGTFTDSYTLQDALLRLHVVGASDSQEDQAVKLEVRDAVLASLEEGLLDLTDLDQAVAYVNTMLPKVEQAANQALAAAGFPDTVTVSLTEEAFPTRDYDSFSLPAGVYKALRVVIGDGDGQNWLCVVFPQLCLSETEAFVETANMAGLSEELTDTLSGEYEIRFWLLEKIGEVKNYFFASSE